MPEIPTTDNVESGLDASAVEDDDNFEDAIDTPVQLDRGPSKSCRFTPCLDGKMDINEVKGVEMDLHRALNECAEAIKKFFNNDILSAQRMMKGWRYKSLYHAHGDMMFQFIPALLTLEPAKMANARAALEHSMVLCDNERRSSSITQTISSIVKRPNYAAYSDLQAHAELIHAEGHLIVACLGAIESEDMGGLLRASMRIRSAYNSYKICSKLLQKKEWDNDLSRCHFESGVKLGLATFNILIAMLPPRLITLLEFVGFSANKEEGIKELLEASELPGLRSVMCRITLLAYHLIISHFASMPIDFDAANKVLNSSLRIYPRSVWFMLFKGRLALLQGNIVESLLTYQIVAKVPNIWAQIHHLAYWEIMWSEAICMNWVSSARYAELLTLESRWSKTIYMYLEAAMILQLGDRATPDQITMAKSLLVESPAQRQRIMGRSLPLEKMAQRRCETFRHRGFLVLPVIEMMYLWNLFPALAKDPHYSDEILKVIERTYEKVEIQTFSTYRHVEGDLRYDVDDRALVYFLRGAMLAAMGMYRSALRHLEPVIKLKLELTEKHHVPFAIVESAMCHFELGDPIVAVNMLNEVRKRYSNYPLESRLTFKIHSKLDYIKSYAPRRF